MGKARTKRQIIRDERKAKRKAVQEANIQKKRRRLEDERHDPVGELDGDEEHDGTREPDAKRQRHEHVGEHDGRPEKEFFGMLADEEQEYFRRADELLELNQFPSDEERGVFLQNVYREAAGKELKLASSQSLSRLMERLILLSTTKQKKSIFEAFAGHFLTLVQHRFASHCCEALFLQSAPVVTQELGAGPGSRAMFYVDTKGTAGGEGEDGDASSQGESSMENLFLMTLDEFEEHLGFLLTDKFASHTLRVLLVVLSGRPLEDSTTMSLLKSKKKEHISVQGVAPGDAGELTTQLRAVPASFTMAVQKIISDATAGMDLTSLRVLVTHPTGNPLLQLLLELDISLNHKSAEKSNGKRKPAADEDVTVATSPEETLLYRLLPGAPASLQEADSQASDFINSMIYDPIGSRLLETLIAHCPGKIFKAMQQNFFAPRIGTYARNDIASYAAIKALHRFSKDDLVEAVAKIVPVVPTLVSKARYNVIKTLFERCKIRGAMAEVTAVTRALTSALGGNPKELVPKLCYLGGEGKNGEEEGGEEVKFQQDAQNKPAMASHGAQLVAIMLSTPGAPARAAQSSLLVLSPDSLYDLATRSMPSVSVLTTALAEPSQNELFHKSLVGALVPRMGELATNQLGHNVVNSIIGVPSRGKERAIPFHVKQTIVGQLAGRESELRGSWMGRSVWRTWKGDMWKTRRSDWVKWAKEVDGETEPKLMPWEKARDKKNLKEKEKGDGKR